MLLFVLPVVLVIVLLCLMLLNKSIANINFFSKASSVSGIRHSASAVRSVKTLTFWSCSCCFLVVVLDSSICLVKPETASLTWLWMLSVMP
jgi:hypothetical protein